MIRQGEVIEVRKPPITYSFEVTDLLDRRVGAKLVPNYLRDVTPAEQLEILELARISGFVDRAKGLGRPTKKDRRSLDEFIDSNDDAFFDFDMDE